MAWSRSVGQAEAAGVALRRERLALATTLAVGDLADAFPLAKVTGELSEFADRALGTAMAAAMLARVSEEEPAGMVALALGKQGAGELTLSGANTYSGGTTMAAGGNAPLKPYTTIT